MDISPSEVLNQDCLSVIFSYLDPTSVKAAALVSR